MRKNAMIHVGFSLILFLMFVVGSFFLLVYGAQGYKHGLEKEEQREKDQIPYAYILTRIHEISSKDAIHVLKIDNQNVLVLENENSLMCIYGKDSYLYELVVQEESQIDLSGGTKIYEVSNFDIMQKQNYYEITLNDKKYKIGVR